MTATNTATQRVSWRELTDDSIPAPAERLTAPAARVHGPPLEHAPVAHRGQGVLAAPAVPREPALAPERDAARVEIVTRRRLDAEVEHDAPPLRSVRPHTAASVSHVDDVVGHLVGDGVAQVGFEVLREQPRVVADPGARKVADVHAGAGTLEVEQDARRRKHDAVAPRRLGHARGARLNNHCTPGADRYPVRGWQCGADIPPRA